MPENKLERFMIHFLAGCLVAAVVVMLFGCVTMLAGSPVQRTNTEKSKKHERRRVFTRVAQDAVVLEMAAKGQSLPQCRSIQQG